MAPISCSASAPPARPCVSDPADVSLSLSPAGFELGRAQTAGDPGDDILDPGIGAVWDLSLHVPMRRRAS
jgi:hypothetical protein